MAKKSSMKRKRRKYIQVETIGAETRVQWGKRGGPVRITVLIPKEHLIKRLTNYKFKPD